MFVETPAGLRADPVPFVRQNAGQALRHRRLALEGQLAVQQTQLAALSAHARRC